MPEIIPETRGRSPLPLGEKKKMISFRISPLALRHLDEHIEWSKARGEKITKARALEVAIRHLPTC
jgi:hypothetical protein